ncbi:RTA-like protein [Penicillium herquei]|nr:RTA-like protein [Penicillium herquei]
MANTDTVVLYHYTPNLVAAVLLAALFGLSTIFHLYQRVKTHAQYFNPFIVGGIFEIIGYGARAVSHFHKDSTTVYAMQSLFILLAPILFAASIYRVLGRVITFLHGEHLSYVSVRWMTRIFVGGDVLSFIIQAAGGGIMTGKSTSDVNIGSWIIVGGLCVQLLSFGAFLITSLIFHWKIAQNPTPESQQSKRTWPALVPRDWRGLLFACYCVSILILVRSIYRVAEFVQGNDGYLISHEIFLYVFDAALMFMVMLIMNVMHPSVVLQKKKESTHEQKAVRWTSDSHAQSQSQPVEMV